MSELKIYSLEEICELILFSKLKRKYLYGWNFRKGKSIDDINKAVLKYKKYKKKHSLNNISLELKILEMYMNDVLKKDRKINFY